MDDEDDNTAITFSEEATNTLLGSDNEMETEKAPDDTVSVSNSDSYGSTRSSPSGNSQQIISSAYRAVRAAKLASLHSRSLNSRGTSFLNPVGSLLDVNDGRNFSAFQINSFKTNRNLTASFDTAALTCSTYNLKPDHVVLNSCNTPAFKLHHDPVVFILSDQSFPASLPTGGEGQCLKIIRLEDSSLADLTSIFLETISSSVVPAGSVVMLHSLSHLAWVGAAAYVDCGGLSESLAENLWGL